MTVVIKGPRTGRELRIEVDTPQTEARINEMWDKVDSWTDDQTKDAYDGLLDVVQMHDDKKTLVRVMLLIFLALEYPDA